MNQKKNYVKARIKVVQLKGKSPLLSSSVTLSESPNGARLTHGSYELWGSVFY